ncbi:BMP family ABC transporter substrate-binding protein [Spirochaeta lutea]|uniref:BMP family ABC transporter substrate-binding protein n=1 Tax=Spirochaeta lutea TaxID=1480694 RepID=UPI00068A72C0|nr:BMP family ABC transporter substrate-binding protein [Spirochaeta lutea]
MKHNSTKALFGVLFFFFPVVAILAGGLNEPKGSTSGSFQIGVFVPGVVEGSPTYEMMVNGVTRAKERAEQEGYSVSLKVFEAGFNQAEWTASLTAMVATGSYDLIVTSNPSLPDIVREIRKSFPEQHFLLLDGYLASDSRVKSIYFNQYEQAYIAGYLAGLVTQPDSGLSGSNAQKRIGLLAGQEYPVMDQQIRPGYLAGAQAVDPDITLDFRVLGNWYDAGKANDLVSSMFRNGVDTVLTIAGGGNQGTISAAQSNNGYVIWYDSPGYSYAPGIIVGSTLVRQEESTYEATLQAITGALDYGNPEILGVQEGAIGFHISQEYIEALPESLRDEFERFLTAIQDGTTTIPSPRLF